MKINICYSVHKITIRVWTKASGHLENNHHMVSKEYHHPGFKGYQQPWQDSRTTNAPVVGLGNPGIEVATGGANDETICGTVGVH